MHAAHRPLSAPDRFDDNEAAPAISDEQPTANYLDHFGLHGAPFSHAPLPFFADGNRGATLEALLYVLVHDEGVVKLTGAAGSGKTTLLRLLTKRLPDTLAPIHLTARSGCSDDDLLDALADALELDAAAGALPVVTRHLLHDKLSARRTQGQSTVILIDDAHALAHSALEEIGLLSEYAVDGRKAALFVLAGRPELNAALAHDDGRKLKEHITHNFTLDALTATEAAVYVDFRLRAVGHTGPALFVPAAVQLLEAAAQGSLRQLDQLADQALHVAHAANHDIVELDDVLSLTDDIPLPVAAAPRKKRYGMLFGSAVGLVAALFGADIALRPTEPPIHAARTTPPVPSPQAASTAPAPVPTASAPPAPMPEETRPKTEPEPSVPSAGIGAKSLTRQRLDAGEAWLKHAPDDHWFIQITAMNADQTESVENLLQKLAAVLPPEQTRAYFGKRDGVPRIGIIYGDFADESEALNALYKLPQSVGEEKPYIRQVKKLR